MWQAMVRYEVREGVATLTIDDPERRNPLGPVTTDQLLEGVVRATADAAVRVIVVTGAGEVAFSAGGDLAAGFADDAIGGHAGRGRFADLLRALWGSGKPTIARVNGHALAGGFGLAVACDITICVDDAKLGAPEVGVGLWPMMITVPLLRAMPPKAVLELVMTGRLITADEGLRAGAVSRVVPRGELDAAVAETAAAFMRHSAAALLLGKDAFAAVTHLDPGTALDRLQMGLTAVVATEDAREGVAAFVEKRSPHFRGV